MYYIQIPKDKLGIFRTFLSVREVPFVVRERITGQRFSGQRRLKQQKGLIILTEPVTTPVQYEVTAFSSLSEFATSDLLSKVISELQEEGEPFESFKQHQQFLKSIAYD